jgi:hypothetical protein
MKMQEDMMSNGSLIDDETNMHYHLCMFAYGISLVISGFLAHFFI